MSFQERIYLQLIFFVLISDEVPFLCYDKSLQSCPTLCDPIDSSPPGSPVPGILQARTLEWVAISILSFNFCITEKQSNSLLVSFVYTTVVDIMRDRNVVKHNPWSLEEVIFFFKISQELCVLCFCMYVLPSGIVSYLDICLSQWTLHVTF